MQLHIHRDGEQFGPYSLDEVRAFLTSGNFHLGELCWYEGCSDWLPLSQVPGLAPTKPPPTPQRRPPQQQLPGHRPVGQQPPPKPVRSKAIKLSLAVIVPFIIFLVIATIIILRREEGGVPETASQVPSARDRKPETTARPESTQTTPGEEQNAPTQAAVPATNSPTTPNIPDEKRNMVPGSPAANTAKPHTTDRLKSASIGNIEDAQRFVVGTWTYTGQGMKFENREMGIKKYTWLKWVINADGTAVIYEARPVDTGWGEPMQGEFGMHTGKYADNGERYYSIRVFNLSRNILSGQGVIQADGTLRYVFELDDGGGYPIKYDVPLTRDDRNPFSK